MRKQSRMGLAAIVLGVVVLAAAAGAVELWSGFVKRSWDGRSRFTVLELANPVVIWTMERGDTQILKLVVPDDLEVSTIGKGVWAARAMPELAKKYGVDWAADSVSAFLGVGLTGVSGHMGFWDTLSWMTLQWGKETKEVKMAGSVWLTQKVAPDGLNVFHLSSAWKQKAEEIFFSSAIAAEGWKLSVINTTSVSGLGAKVARIAEAAGYKVIALAQGADTPQSCRVEGRLEQKESLGLTWLQNNFSCEFATADNLDTNELKLIVGKKFESWGD